MTDGGMTYHLYHLFHFTTDLPPRDNLPPAVAAGATDPPLPSRGILPYAAPTAVVFCLCDLPCLPACDVLQPYDRQSLPLILSVFAH